LDSLNEDLPPVTVLSLHEEVAAEVLIAAAKRVALVESERPVACLGGADLYSN
jgi:hypothetical protein